MSIRFYYALITLGLLFIVPSLFASDPLTIKTDRGKVRGTLTSDGRVRAFKGILYAAPPVGNLRWQPPQPAIKWSGIHPAKDFGMHCFQSESYTDMVFHDPGPSEDCLTLNIWTPTHAKPGARLPVMIWIYGGGFLSGGTSELRQDGQFLAHRDAIIVSMNYRLGIFGFLALSELTAESAHHASGNYGLLDQAAAIAWVRHNIKAFGGDASNMTLFGQSAGSMSVSAQMASPLTRHLLAKAIGESGGALLNHRHPFLSREKRESSDAAFLKTCFGTTKLDDLRKIAPEELLRKTVANPTAPYFGPDVDGYFLPEPVAAIYAAGKQAHIPILAGWVADEARSQVTSAMDKPTVASFTKAVNAEFGTRASDLLRVYPASTDLEAIASAGDLVGDRYIAFGAWRWIEAQSKTGGAPIYRYRFDLGTPGDMNHPASQGAFHSDDIDYVFGTLDSRSGAVIRPEDRKLSEQMGEYWTNFARSGNPNASGLTAWPSYEPSTGWMVMHLDRILAAEPDDSRNRYLLLEQVWGDSFNGTPFN